MKILLLQSLMKNESYVSISRVLYLIEKKKRKSTKSCIHKLVNF